MVFDRNKKKSPPKKWILEVRISHSSEKTTVKNVSHPAQHMAIILLNSLCTDCDTHTRKCINATTLKL